VGEKVPSVFGGPADRERYGALDIGQATTTPGRRTPYSATELDVFEAFRRVRELRTNGSPSLEADLGKLADTVAARFSDEWLLQPELLEMAGQKLAKPPASLPWAKALEDRLRAQEKSADSTTAELIRNGLALVKVAD